MHRSLAALAAVAVSMIPSASTFTPYQGQDPNQPTEGLTLNALNLKGCFSSPGTLVNQGPYQFQTSGWCQAWCVRNSWPVMAITNGTDCYCGDAFPSQTTDDSACNQVSCPGYDQDKCGGPNAWMVWDDGFQGTASSVVGPSLASTGIPTAAASSVSQVASTVFVTQPGSTPSPSVINVDPSSASSGPNKAAIAAGVVVGIIALAAIVGGGLFLMQQKRRKAHEEEVRRRESMINFVTGGEKPSTSPSLTDSRLEPSVMFTRRQSDGSIMDNQDYSRRILKVTNPDDR